MYQHEWAYLNNLDPSFQEVFNLFLHDSNAAVFFLDLNLNIVMQNGNEQLMKKLNAVNLEVGANLSEERIGTNAAALASYTQARSCVIGTEHYLEVLQDHACVATPIFIANNVQIGYAMYVVDLATFEPAFYEKLYQYLDLQHHLLHLEFDNLILSLKNELLNTGTDSKECAILFIDCHGLIIHVNEWAMDYFRMGKHDLLGKQLSKAFPELIGALDGFQSGENINAREIIFAQRDGKKCKFLMDCYLSIKESITCGMILRLSEDKPQPKVSAKKACQGAHYTFNDLIGVSPIFSESKNIAQVASVSNCNVMIVGESGSGKELFAQAIHNNSNRKNEPFVSINCAAIPKDLIYSELFGYVEGAFTGAKKGGAPGKFELANKGTLFLDEISEIPNEMQAVLLRVLEEDSVTRLGSSNSIPIDVRIIAATNRDICSSIATKQFRLDLYHRLCIIRIDIAPLRRRKEDIYVLADYYLHVFNSKHNKNIIRITPEAMKFMEHCAWLGNVRELRNVIERGVIFCSANELDISALPKDLEKHHRDPTHQIQSNTHSGDGLVQQFQEKLDEKKHIELLLKKRNNNKTLVAQDLGITRATLYRRMKFMGIQ